MNAASSGTPVIDHEAAAALIEPLTDVVVEAGAAILAVNRRAINVDHKRDGSPVTEADLSADRVIGAGLRRLVPELATLSEERVQQAKVPHHGSFFLIDPLDGTREFVAGRNEFTVNVALMTNGTPLLGIIAAPSLGLLWRGLVGRGAERVRIEKARPGTAEPIRTRPMPKPGEPWIAAVSRSHPDTKTEAFIERRPGAVRLKLGSAIKFGRLAEGAADIYPRLAPTSEWDVAAGHAVLTAAGGKVTDANGSPLHFGQHRNGSFIVPAFIAWGDPAAAALY